MPWPGAAAGHGVILAVHVAASVIGLWPAGLWVADHLERTRSSPRWVWAVALLGMGGGLWARRALAVDEGVGWWDGFRLAISGQAGLGSAGAPAMLSALGVGAAALLVVARAVLAPSRDPAAARWSGLASLLVFGWAWSSGAATLVEPRESKLTVVEHHAAVGLAAATFAAFHVGWSLLLRRGLRAGVARLGAVAVAMCTFLGLRGLWLHEHRNPRLDRALAPGVELRTIPLDRAAREQILGVTGGRPPLDPRGCGVAGCHAEITAEWMGSPHRFAAATGAYRAALAETLASRGDEGVLFCARCHDPERVAAGAYVAGAYDASAYDASADAASGADAASVATIPASGPDAEPLGVGCIACHGALVDPSDPSRSRPLLGVLAVPPEPPRGAFGRAALRLDPRAHDEAFGVDAAVRSNELCLSCHRLVLDEDFGVAHRHVLQDVSTQQESSFCQACHLPIAERPFDRYSHRMAGIHADLDRMVPAGLAGPEVVEGAAAARTFSSLVEAGPIADPGWPERPKLERGPELLVSGGGGRILRIEATWEGRGVVVRTANLRAGHRVPSGPFDLQEWWLHWRIEDDGGALVGEGGRPQRVTDARGCATDLRPPDAIRLGGRELDADGRDLRRHRLFDLASVVDRRVIPPGGEVEDVLPITIPEGQAAIRLRARWLFRRIQATFLADTQPAPCEGPRLWEVGVLDRRLARDVAAGGTLPSP